jgi:hypothetical protein
MNLLKQIWSWISKPTMNKLAVLLCLAFTVLFLLSFFETTGELSYFPAAWLVSSGIISLLYLVDRVGFSKIDTIYVLRNDPKLYYTRVLPMYGIGILVGHIIALLLATT